MAGFLAGDVPVFTAEGQSSTEAAANPPLNLEEIHPHYFSTFQVSLLRGRAFTAADTDTAPLVAIVSADVATQVCLASTRLASD